jgi:hypothetical protein
MAGSLENAVNVRDSMSYIKLLILFCILGHFFLRQSCTYFCHIFALILTGNYWQPYTIFFNTLLRLEITTGNLKFFGFRFEHF